MEVGEAKSSFLNVCVNRHDYILTFNYILICLKFECRVPCIFPALCASCAGWVREAGT